MDKRWAIQIRYVTAQPTYKVFAVVSKYYTEERYSVFNKIDRSIAMDCCHFSEEIENLIERKHQNEQ